jgi:hypothetical protein
VAIAWVLAVVVSLAALAVSLVARLGLAFIGYTYSQDELTRFYDLEKLFLAVIAVFDLTVIAGTHLRWRYVVPAGGILLAAAGAIAYMNLFQGSHS